MEQIFSEKHEISISDAGRLVFEAIVECTQQ